MKSAFLSLFSFLFLFSSPSWASRGYVYESTFFLTGAKYIDQLESIPTDVLSQLTPDKRDVCLQRYRGLLNDGVLDVRIAIGYFDWTTGTNVFFEKTNYGLSPSIDIGAYAALKNLLTSRCEGKARFCGFRIDPQNPYRFLREVDIHGNKYTARVEVYFASATEYLNSNLGDYRSHQEQRTQFMESYFTRALQNADAVFYFGHSRNGGGPDFAPPVFIPGLNKLDYDGYYEVKRPGFKKMINALKSSSKKAPVIGLMSCASRDHFLSKLRTTSPQSGIITSMDVLTVDVVYTALIGGIDALLRGQCQKSFYQELRMTSNNQKYITMDGMFE